MNHLYFHCTLSRLEATEALGFALGQALLPGEQLGLEGGLGAGKTTLTRSLAEGYGVFDLNEVASPTYGYAHIYDATKGRLNHMDFYRLGDVETAMSLGLDELLNDAGAATVVEWAELFAELLQPEALWLTLRREAGSAQRTAQLRVPAIRAEALTRALPEWVGAPDASPAAP